MGNGCVGTGYTNDFTRSYGPPPYYLGTGIGGPIIYDAGFGSFGGYGGLGLGHHHHHHHHGFGGGFGHHHHHNHFGGGGFGGGFGHHGHHGYHHL